MVIYNTMAGKSWFNLSSLGKERSMQVQNFGDRVKGARRAEMLRRLAETTATGLILDGNNPVLTTKNGVKIAEAAIVSGEEVLINLGGDSVNTTRLTTSTSPWLLETLDFGSLVSRNVIAHIAGPNVNNKNYLEMRGYSDDSVGGRDINEYAGMNLWYDSDNSIAVFRYDVGADTSSHTDPNSGIVTESTNYNVGQTMRMLITGIGSPGSADDNLGQRSVTWEFRTATDPIPNASWTAKMMLTQ